MDDKIYFKPGDTVTLRQHSRMHSPVMLVVKKEKAYFNDDMIGIRCRWFTASNLMQEAVFNFKDLILYDNKSN